jgi:hypothetical protein
LGKRSSRITRREEGGKKMSMRWWERRSTGERKAEN